MYKILVRGHKPDCKKPLNPLSICTSSKSEDWVFYKECGKVIQSEDLSIIVEKFEQLLYTFPAKDLKLIKDIDFMLTIDDKEEDESGYFPASPVPVTPSAKPLPKKPTPVIVKVLN